MNACQAVRELLTADVLSCLDEGQGALVRAHLEGCPGCQTAREEAGRAMALVVAPEVEPPPEVWHKLRGRLERERSGDEPVRDVAEPGAVIAISCSFCRGGLVRVDTVYCASCLAPHHAECFAEHGRCSVMGCGETRVVRPEALPAPPRRVEPAEPLPRHRWRWLAGGLLGVCAGGAVAAFGLGAPRRLPAPLPPVRTAERPTPPSPALFAPPRLDVDVREATVGELCARLEAVTGVKVHLHPEAAGRALPDREWWSADWRQVLEDVSRAAGLELVLGGEGGPTPWALLAPPEGDRLGVRAPARSWVTSAHLFAQEGGPGSWTQTGLAELSGARALVAPRGERLALVGERRVRLFRGAEPLGGLRLAEPVVDAAWSQDGKELFLLCAPASGAGAVLGDGGSAAVLRLEARPAGLVPLARVELPPARASGLGAWRRVVPAGTGWALVAGDEGVAPLMIHVLEGEPLDGGLRYGDVGQVLACAQLPQGVLLASARGVFLAQPGGGRRQLALEPEAWTLAADDVDGGPRLALRPTPDGRRVLVQERVRARLLELIEAKLPDGTVMGTDGRWGETRISHLPGSWPWPGALSPDGQRLAWVDGGTLFLRPVEGRVEPEIPPLDLPGDPVGVSWRPDGAAVVAWSERAVCLVEPRLGIQGGASGLGRAACELVHELPEAPGAIQEVAWVDARRFLVVTSLERPRSPQVTVLPARPGEVSWARAERDERGPQPLPGGVPAREQPSAREADGGPTAPPAAEAPPGGEGPAPPRRPETPRVDLSHVRPLQRWVFRLGEPRGDRTVREEWTVRQVEGERVVYERRVFLGPRQIGEAALETWTPDVLLTAEVRSAGAGPHEHELSSLTLGRVVLPVWIDRQPAAQVELWRAAGGDPEHRYTFPGLVRDLRAGQVQRVLLSVDE